MKRGLTHIYTGNGKGKTTAAMGLALRASGCGLRVAIFQFMKKTPSGEVAALALHERVTLCRAGTGCAKFLSDMTDEEKARCLDAQQELFDQACEAACDGAFDMVVLDEALGAMHAGAMDARQLAYLIEHRHRGTELVLTGRGAPQPLIDLADYVTEMRPIKHPYDRGTHARRGVEY
ncbi:MAG: cob(I)yrinic acid a,c-diamide adenosyltransferase [Clostridiales bacterium]|nr:cob(I)yrinic acid a,c-diamide adenosyltransferase [Clostridiales bacterium]